MKQPCVYILANKPRGILYTGVTSDLVARTWQHKNDLASGFSEKYQVHTLVYYELHETMLEAITREKQLKKWNRDWKIKLIEGLNENWADLYEQLSA
jgi:putative endonuclease